CKQLRHVVNPVGVTNIGQPVGKHCRIRSRKLSGESQVEVIHRLEKLESPRIYFGALVLDEQDMPEAVDARLNRRAAREAQPFEQPEQAVALDSRPSADYC